MADLDSSYRWLQRRKFPFPLALELLLKQVRQAAREAQGPNLAKKAGQAFQVTDRFGDRLERAVARLECAVAYAMAASDETARRLLEEGIVLLHPSAQVSREFKHYYAVANWLVGELLESSSDQDVEVILAWQTSLNIFEGLVFHPANISGDERWYRDRYHEMRARIEAFINREQPPSPAEAQPPTTLPEDWLAAQLFAGGHQILEVIGKIPAGGFGPISGDSPGGEKINLEAEMEDFSLSGSDHAMYNLRGTERIIRLNSAQEYFLLQVTSDSMNQANIDEGDYVLIRRQETAGDGDIVAASIQAIDQAATLKRYRERDGKISLLPESSNPIWKPKDFTRQDLTAGGKAWKFRIHGVTLAVFKPCCAEAS